MVGKEKEIFSGYGRGRSELPLLSPWKKVMQFWGLSSWSLVALSEVNRSSILINELVITITSVVVSLKYSGWLSAVPYGQAVSLRSCQLPQLCSTLLAGQVEI